ncbi:pyridine nucleotide-disulfide oxidoreductase [Alkalilimnicola ehrlichii MLHE-1]|uniref:Oxidoreductase FAD/NAD(P)-binding domain protein n=1 Tax=Alkalilimnicola ehrlichii (strain ATCC BAA-1101 / DSM 17681 / MLHE-1) TaxID=187272 RepID=Q0A9S5_ALKEH|nr:oxidoreductase [Alkalilimnicola ehrlichii]ABI56412.1 oxidoreductase FAD/NAD(P)-binding domain protein [Alkalilimnicola ehrlichii MLHE-1]
MSPDAQVPPEAGGPQGRDFPLGIAGFRYADLHNPAQLAELLSVFDQFLATDDPVLFEVFQQYRTAGAGDLSATERSAVLTGVAPQVSRFLARLFGIESEWGRLRERVQRELDTVMAYRDQVVAKVRKRFAPEDLADWDLETLDREVSVLQEALSGSDNPVEDPERALAASAMSVLQAMETGHDPDGVTALRQSLEAHPDGPTLLAEALSESTPQAFLAALLNRIERWTFAAVQSTAIGAQTHGWTALRGRAKTDFENQVPCEPVAREGYTAYRTDVTRRRDGFALTDPGLPLRRIVDEVEHCLYCHDRDRDFCSKGMRAKAGGFRNNPLGTPMVGCPLEEKISEAQYLKHRGDSLAALAVVMVDNPMVPGTGHRICKDCVTACIYQKVEPVAIPEVETAILREVLALPYGFEIYSLLTRWNPLHVQRPHMLPYNGKNVLVAGMGPAGYTLAHYLLNEGFGVVGIDGLKIEPLPDELTGVASGVPAPVRDFDTLYERLDERTVLGFGGVAEYGITARWDKNFLKVIYLTLARRRAFRCFGGVRLGGTLTVDDAWALGFHHIAIAAGAGKPTVIGLENNLVRGIRQASDFLMGLQLTGAAQRNALANMQVRLPAGVVGGGLTAVDTTTELLAYYPIQVERTLERYEAVVSRFGEEAVLAEYDGEEREILDEFLDHGRAVRAERARAEQAGECPDFAHLLSGWGGVTLFYRKGLHDAPAYRQNHDELVRAMEEGLILADGMAPQSAMADGHGHLKAVRFEKMHQQEDGDWVAGGETLTLPLRTLVVAAGTSPNVAYEREHPGTFELDGKFFRAFEPGEDAPHLTPVGENQPTPKIGNPAPFTSYEHDGRRVSFFGDNHPVYAGNVVRAMASAKDGYPYIVDLFRQALDSLDPADQPQRDAAISRLLAHLDDQLQARVQTVRRLAPSIVEVVARAPLQARNFQPGQFYRVQNYASCAPRMNGVPLVTEGMALTGAWVDRAQGLVSVIVLEVGASSRLCATWQPGDPLVLMGPTGAPTEIPAGETVLLAGGGLGNAVLFSIGRALRAAGSRVLYFAGYRNPGDIYKVDEIEAAADVVVWSVDPGPGVQPVVARRPQDRSVVGNIVEAMTAYAAGELGSTAVPMGAVDRIMAIGSDRMMAAVKAARRGALEPYLKPGHVALGSINSPMQCMMKAVCAQCLCRQEDPDSGEERFVFSCCEQDQPLDAVDFEHLNGRLRQNSVQEKLTNRWLDLLLAEAPDIPRV